MIKKLDGGIRGAIKRALKYGNLQYKIPCAVFDKMGYSNHELQDLEVRNKVYHYLIRNYSMFLDSFNYQKKDSGIASDTVWVCWLQGMDNAPNIVKSCCQSLYRWIPSKKICVIDSTNLFDYVQLPTYVINKWKNGLISNTHFSDFVRLSVLTQFGGIWVDATVFMTGPLPDYIEKSDFFVFQSNEYDATKVGESWLIKANSHNRILQATLDLMNEYWIKEDKIRDYFIMFIFMKMASDKYSNDNKDMLKVPAALPLMMQKNMCIKFSKNLYREMCTACSVHKLTYKFKPEITEDTLYEYICKGSGCE